MKNRKQLFMTSRLLLIIVAVALVLSMGLTACGLPSGTPNGKTPDVADSGNAGEDQPAQSLTTTSRVNLDETYGELLPLYETLTEQEGSAYSLAFNLTGVVNTADVSGAIDLRYVVTVDDDGAISMMFLDENDNVLFSYKDGKISLDGFGMDIGFYQHNIENDQLPAFPRDAAGSIMEILAFLNGFLSDFDTLSQVVPAVFNSMNFDTTGLVMTSQDGEYVFNANCQPLLILASTYLSDSFDDLLMSLPFEIDIASLLGVESTEASDLELIIAAVDDMFFDGALLSGYVDLNAHLTITENGFDVSVALLNAADHDECYFYLEIGASIEDEIPIEVPEVTTLHDIQADIPISLPQSGIDMTIHAIFHTADIFAEENKDFITATVDMNNKEDVASIIVNDGYLYVDINKLVMIANKLVEEPTEYTYALDFGDNKIHVILRDISRFLDEMLEDVGFYDLFYIEDDSFLHPSLIVMGDIDENMTESELREHLYAMAIYSDRAPREIFDYEITSCGLCSAHGSWVTILYDETYHLWNNLDQYAPNPTNVGDGLWAECHFWEIYENMSEAALRDVLHVGYYSPEEVYDNGIHVDTRWIPVEINDYTIDSFSVCPHCGFFRIDVSSDGRYGTCYGRISNTGMYGHAIDFSGRDYISNTATHQSLVAQYIDPNEYLYSQLVYDPKTIHLGMTEVEVYDLVRLLNIYVGLPPEEVLDYYVDEFSIEGNRFRLRLLHEDYDENGIAISGYGVGTEGFLYGNPFLGSILPFLRDIDPAQEPMGIYADMIAGIFGIYLENQDMLGDAIQVEDIENGKNITVCLSDSTLVDSDLLAFVNTFFGLPGEDGFVDLNGQTLYYFLSEALGEDGIDDLEEAGGFDLEDFCNDLYLNVTGYLNNNNKLRFGFSLSGADTDPEVDETYLSIGIIEYHAVVTDSAYDANLTAEDLAAANPINEIVAVLLDCFDKLRAASGNLE